MEQFSTRSVACPGVRMVRRELGLTQKAFAVRCGVCVRTVRNWENTGRGRRSYLLDAAKRLNISFQRLVTGAVHTLGDWFQRLWRVVEIVGQAVYRAAEIFGELIQHALNTRGGQLLLAEQGFEIRDLLPLLPAKHQLLLEG